MYRWDAFLTHQDTARRLGKAVALEVLQDDTGGRVLDRLYATGTRKVCTAGAVRAARVCGVAQRSVPLDTTSITVHGAARPPEEAEASEGPLRIPSGESKDTRPDLKPLGFATRCVDRAVPLWGTPHDGKASETTVPHTLPADLAPFVATHGVPAGASLSVADAARVTAAHLAALGDTRFIPRFPAPSTACGRLMAEAVAPNAWEEVGVLAHTQPTTPRPGTSSKASEGQGTRSGTPSRAVVVHASAQDKRRQPRLARDIQASESTIPSPARTAAQQEYGCRAARCPLPPIGWPSRWRHGPCRAGAGPVPPRRARSKPGARGCRRPSAHRASAVPAWRERLAASSCSPMGPQRGTGALVPGTSSPSPTSHRGQSSTPGCSQRRSWALVSF